MHRRRASNCRIVVPTHDGDDDDDAREGVGEGVGDVAIGVGVVPTRDDDDGATMMMKTREDMCVRSMATTTTRARASNAVRRDRD